MTESGRKFFGIFFWPKSVHFEPSDQSDLVGGFGSGRLVFESGKCLPLGVIKKWYGGALVAKPAKGGGFGTPPCVSEVGPNSTTFSHPGLECVVKKAHPEQGIGFEVLIK